MAKRYRVGIDVGLYSTGLAAIEIDDSDDDPCGAMPINLLSVMSVIHDGGVDPDLAKSAGSRKSSSGVARRARRMRKRRTERLKRLDKTLGEFGYDCERAIAVADMAGGGDPYYSWKVRSEAARGFIANDAERGLAVTIAVRSVARHRGWRNPYSSIGSLHELSAAPSSFYRELVRRLEDRNLLRTDTLDVESETRLTPAELVERAGILDNRYAFRTEGSSRADAVPLGKLHQSDYYHELRKILRVQMVPEERQKRLLDVVFEQANPRDVAASAERVASDDLPPYKPRATKASPEFQRFRILTTLCNLSVRHGGERAPLSREQRQLAYEYLSSSGRSAEPPSWHDLARHVGLAREDLVGVGGRTEDGEPISAKVPPTMDTERALAQASKRGQGLRPVLEWWQSESTSDLEREMFAETAGRAGVNRKSLDDEEARALSGVDQFLSSLGDEALTALDKLELPSGRAAYSVETMRRLNARMLDEGMSLHEARKVEFGIDDDWKPRPNELGTPTGNPSADRTIRIVSRWIKACVEKWGVPQTVNIEHVREGFVSPKVANELRRESNRRYRANQDAREKVAIELRRDLSGVHRSDVRREQALQRQNCQCAYCGRPIDFTTAQMDHIVPRKGAGSTNERENLVAVCADCNLSKGNVPFATWADERRMADTIERVRRWTKDPSFKNMKAFRSFQRDVISRLRKTEEDEPIDTRSIESVAWMARELSSQVEGYLDGIENVSGSTVGPSIRVHVYRGWITSEARRASGLEGRLPWIGDRRGKTRFDRRHHAVDACVIALLRPGVAQVLAERDSMRRASDDLSGSADKGWEDHEGSDKQHVSLYEHWKGDQMEWLCALLRRALEQDRIVVTHQLRLCRSRGRVHEDTVRKFVTTWHLGDALSPGLIDKSASVALWTALTRLPDYDSRNGLPEDPSRQIVIHGKVVSANDFIPFMGGGNNAITCPVRGGWARVGNIHHARIYRIPNPGGRGFRYGMVRVVAIDLARCHGDLFGYELPASSLSLRFASKSVKNAIGEGRAEYVGWVVTNDEVVIDPSAPLFDPKGGEKISKFMKAFPGTRRFAISGFFDEGKVSLRPMQLASEGLPDIGAITDQDQRSQAIARTYAFPDWSDDDLKAINEVVSGRAVLSVNKLFGSGVDVIRRSTLGYPRWSSTSGVPASWSTREGR